MTRFGWNVVVVNVSGDWLYVHTCDTRKEARAWACQIRIAHPNLRRVFTERSCSLGV